MDPSAATRAKTTLRALIGAGLLLLVGLGILVSAALWLRQPELRSITDNLGGVVVATALISVWWELAGKRNFSNEVLEKAHLSNSLERAGVTDITTEYLSDTLWNDLFRDCHTLDIVVAYASTWRNKNYSHLQNIASTRGNAIRVFLPDYNDPGTVATLAERFSLSTADLCTKIKEAERDFKALKTGRAGKVTVLLRPGDLVYSCYRFNNRRAVMTLYSHGKERRSDIPTFVVGPGTLLSFISADLDAMSDQAVTRTTITPGGH